jgi:ABC-type nitrate/sulfonate/bicarbonate transport system ATPase subunit
MKSIRAQNLVKVYCTGEGQTPALGPVNLEILAGELVCILGESGCGKSTLWRILAGLDEPTAGNVFVDNKPVVGPDYKRGVVFQNPALLPWLSVEENIALGFKIRNENVPKKLVQETINLVGIDGFEKTKPHNLSGGMAQRAAIARALVSNPDILLMDEPFSALDALTRLHMQQALLDIWQKHAITIVFITHDIDEAISLATRIVVLTPRPGKIAQVFDVPLTKPRLHSSSDFMQLKSKIADQLILSFNHSKQTAPSLNYA